MADFVAHDNVGRILMVGHCPDDALELQGKMPDGEQLACLTGTARLGQDWVDLTGDAPLVRACLPSQMTLRGSVLRAVPHPARIEVYGPAQLSGRITEDIVELSFDLPGTYQVTVVPDDPKWLEWETEIVV